MKNINDSFNFCLMSRIIVIKRIFLLIRFFINLLRNTQSNKSTGGVINELNLLQIAII